jgi:hypothetical protein
LAEQLELPFNEPLGPKRPDVRANVLRTAEKYIVRDRADEHGDMEDNFGTIAKYWSEHLGTHVSAVDVAVMMTLLKIARLKNNEPNWDNWVDGCGYLACGAELVSKRLDVEEEALNRGG